MAGATKRARRSLAAFVVALMALAFPAAGQNIVAHAGGGIGDGGAVAVAAWQGRDDMVLDPSGTVLVVESAGHRIRSISPGGVVSTWAGARNAWYHGDHPPLHEVALSTPARAAIDGSGSIYVYEAGPRRISEIDSGGSVSIRADAVALGNRYQVKGLAADPAGNLFLAADNAIWRLDRAGTFTRVAGTGIAGFSGDGGAANVAQISGPGDVLRAPDGTLYISDAGNGRIRRVTTAGLISTLAEVPMPGDLALSPDGDVYVACGDYRVRRIDSAGVVSVVAGNGQNTGGSSGDGGPAVDAVLSVVSSILAMPDGDLLVAHGPGLIRRVDGAGIIHPWSGGRYGDGPSRFEAAFGQPSAMATDAQGNVYLAHPNRIRRVTPQGAVSTVAGADGFGSSGDGGPALEAIFRTVEGLAVDGAGNLYFAETASHVVRVVRANGTVERFAGNGSSSASGDGGPAVQAGLPSPKGLAVDAQGRLYIASRRGVRRVEPDGSISTFAGGMQSGFAGDGGPATQALFCSPDHLAVVDGGLVIADGCNHRIRRVDAAGIVQTIAGTGSDARPVEGVAALESPFTLSGEVVAAGGGLYVSEPVYRRIYRIGADGIVALAAGNGQSGYAGDGGPAIGASFNYIGPMAPATDGGVMIADIGINLLRKLDAAGGSPTPPELSVADAVVVEGDSGSAFLRFAVSLTTVPSAPVTFRVRTQGGTALESVDYLAPATGDRAIGPGQSSLLVEVEVRGDVIDEPDETLQLIVEDIYGASAGRTVATGTILDDDQPAGTPPAPVARGERRVIDHSVASLDIDVLANDDLDAGLMAGGSLAIVGALPQGQATIVGDVVRFVPRDDFSGDDRFRYRVCDSLGRCSEADVSVVVRPVPRVDLDVASRSGRHRQPVSDLPAMDSLRFDSTPLVAPALMTFAPAADDTPASPWDSPIGRAFVRLPMATEAGAAAVDHQLLVDVLASTGGEQLDLYLGMDFNGDGQPQADEMLCLDSQSATPRCEARLQRPDLGTSHYWVMLHNRNGGDASANLAIFDVPMLAADGSFVATGPGRLGQGESFDVKLGWNAQGMLPGDWRAGFVTTRDSARITAGGFPVRLHRTGAAEEPLLLASGQPVTLRLAPGTSHRRIFIDVPEGSTNLRVSTSAPDASFRIQLVHGGADADPADTTVPDAPAAGVATARVKRGDVLQAVPAPGRWYIVARNEGAMPGAMTITATVEGAAPVVRPGSYFNAARPGHGLFLYPAGNQWAGLWYAYADDGRPTWYYLQGAAPGANGVWAGDLYRAAWHGTSNVLAKVGLATVTPTGPDAFTFSYTLDGLSGSEPMAALGRGCPTLAGLPQDLSSHWFNRQRAGTGYSVQLWEQYEYLAAFVYDGRGEPRFLAGERSGFGGAETVLALEQLRGACPTCAWVPPVRANVGTLLRRITNGALSRIELDVEYIDGVPGTWTAVDEVELLGGAGTTQGCAP